MWRVRRQEGFTTVELLIAVFVVATGVIALIGTLDMSRRLTTEAEMKEAASHIGQQKLEELRALEYEDIALDSIPATSADPANPGYYVTAAGPLTVATYRWNQKADAPLPHTEPLLICPTVGVGCPAPGKVPGAAETWSDGRLSGKVYRYVTTVDDASCGAVACPGIADYKRLTVVLTFDQPGAPKKPLLMSALMTDPDSAPPGEVVDGDENPLTDPDTRCASEGVLVDCVKSIEGSVKSFYLYDTPATQSARQPISASHATHPTVAPSGTCSADVTSGCPVPDLMGDSPPPDTTPAPPLYSYSNEITGGTWPGGAVLRRDTSCAGTPSATDNTKGHMWVTPALGSPMKLSGDAALNLSTVTFSGVSASVTMCVRFYDVPGSIANLVAEGPTDIGTGSHTSSTWPTSARDISFAMDFRGEQPDHTIPSGNRLGIRVWVTEGSGADIAAIYDHPDHPSFVQVNEAS